MTTTDPLRHAALEAAKALEPVTAFTVIHQNGPFERPKGSGNFGRRSFPDSHVIADGHDDEGQYLAITVGDLRRLAAARAALLAELAREPWTREAPTVPGWYWWRGYGVAPTVLELRVNVSGDLYLPVPYHGASLIARLPTGGEWSVPILCPAAPVPPPAARPKENDDDRS